MLEYADVRHARIDVDAQRALMRMSRDPLTAAIAKRMRDEVFANRLFGIFKENQEQPAKRAVKWATNWWTMIPPDDDAIVVLDENEQNPLIAFRHTIANDQLRLDDVLVGAFRVYEDLRAGRISAKCGAEGRVERRIVPRKFCFTQMQAPGCACPMTKLVIWINAFIPPSPSAFIAPDGTRMTLVRDFGRGMITDERTFDASFPPPASRCSSRIDLFIPTMHFVPRHRTGGEIIVDRFANRHLCTNKLKGVTLFDNVKRGTTKGVATFSANLTVRLPSRCTFTPYTLSIDAKLNVSFTLPRPESVAVSFEGKSNAFAIEAYAAPQGCLPDMIVNANVNDPSLFLKDATTKSFSGTARVACNTSEARLLFV